MKRLLIWILGLGALSFIIGAAAGVLGYYSHKLQLEPIYSLAERADTKGRRVIGMPTVTHGMVDRIETIYLRMRGKVYLMPDNDFRNGGALTTWGEDVLVMHQSGKVFYLDDARGLILSDLGVPDNGKAAYGQLAAEKYPGRNTRIAAVRYNDIEYIEGPGLRGLALSYTYIDAENECYRNRISWLPLGDEAGSIKAFSAKAEDWELLWDANPCLAFNATRELIVPYMAGGRMAFKAPNLLYLGSGEYHLDGLYRPDVGIQTSDSDYGKTIEINIETRTARHYSVGHRNLQGVTLDKQGRLWTTEHGMRGGDELNLIIDGENYGWPLENLGTLYSGVPAPGLSGVGRHEVHRAPVYAWLPSAAVSALATVDGFHEAWDGDLLIGSLKGRTLYRARVQGERLIFLEEIPIGQRIRDVMQVAPDQIALWLDTNELVILTLEERADPLKDLPDALVAGGMTQEHADEARDILESCAECHYFEENLHGAGPSLHKVFGRPMASTAFENYSDALRAKGGVWDSAALTAYLADPEALVPETGMAGLGVGDADLAGRLTTALKWLSEAAGEGHAGH